MRALETSLFQTYASRFLGWSRGTKWVQSKFRALISSLYRLLVSHFFRWRRGRIWFKITKSNFEVHSSRSAWKFKGQISNSLKHRVSILTQVAFCAGQDTENEFKVRCENFNHRLSTSSKSLFELMKRQKLSSKWNKSNWKIAFSTLRKSFLGWSRGTKWVQSTLRAFESSLCRFLVSRILSWKRGRIWVKFYKSKFKIQSSRSEVKGETSNFKAFE